MVSTQAYNIFTPPEDLIPGRTYYWRVDTETSNGSIIEGDLWSFEVSEARSVMPSVLVRSLPETRYQMTLYLKGLYLITTFILEPMKLRMHNMRSS